MYGLPLVVPVRSALGVRHLVPASRPRLLPRNFGVGFRRLMGAALSIVLIFPGFGRSPGLRVKVPSCLFPWAVPYAEAGGALRTLPGLLL